MTTTPVAGTPRSATFTAPAFSAASATLFFRLTVGDGFGATVQSTNLTVALDELGAVGAVRRSARRSMAATNSTTNDTTVNQIYIGQAGRARRDRRTRR